MMIKFITASITGSAVLCVILNHKITEITMILQFTLNILRPLRIIFIKSLIINAFIGWVAYCGHVAIRKKHNKYYCMNCEAYDHAQIQIVLFSIFYKDRLTYELILVEIEAA